MKKLNLKYQKCLSFIKLPDGTVKSVSLTEAIEYGRQMESAQTQIDKLLT